MRIVVQRCSRAEVRIDGEIAGKIGRGLMLLVGITHQDTEKEVAWMAKKVAGLRIFEDAEGKMNLSLTDISGSVLSISQFTLYGDARKGNRPSFVQAARPEIAEPLYRMFNRTLAEQYGIPVETGRFGADMKVDFVNNGPVTILLDTAAQ